MQLQIQSEQLSGASVLRCEGRIVFGPETDALMKAASALAVNAPQLVIELSGVRSIDSCGIGALVGIMVSARNRGGDLRLVNPSQKVRDVLRVTGLHCVFQTHPTVEAAADAYSGKIVSIGA